MSGKVWSIGIQKHIKMIHYHVHIRSTDQFNQVGVHEKSDRNEINSVDDHCVWLCIRVTSFSSIGKVFELPGARFLKNLRCNPRRNSMLT